MSVDEIKLGEKRFSLKKRMSDEERTKYFFIALFASLIPLGYFFFNSQKILTGMRLKDKVKDRRDRLDTEHGIDREGFMSAMKELDKSYWVSEKEDIDNLKKLGRQGFYKPSEESLGEDRILQEDTYDDEDVTIKYISKIGNE